MKKTYSIAFKVCALVFVAIMFSGCDETPISEIVVYSGSWTVILEKQDASLLGQCNTQIEDDGSFCSEISISGSQNLVRLKGQVLSSGVVSGGFAANCGQTAAGVFEGDFGELLGAGYASGTFNYSGNPGIGSGTWYARRTE